MRFLDNWLHGACAAYRVGYVIPHVIPFAVTRYENSQIEGYLDFYPNVFYIAPPQIRWGASIGPSTALGNPRFAFRGTLLAFLERFSASNAFPTPF
jgi:hypothetical protein